MSDTITPPASDPPQARRGAVGAGLPRAAQHGRADQEGRRRPERARADRSDLRAGRVPLDRQAGPALADAVVGPLHAAQAGRPRRARRASAEPEELEDEFFMMRIRIDGGQLTSEQLRAIAWASERFGRDVADVTDRQNVQLHWIRIEDVPAIWERLEAVGLLDAGGVRRHAARDPRVPARRRRRPTRSSTRRRTSGRSRRRFVGDPAFSNLPRKYKTSISGCREQCTNPEINDVSFVGVDRPDARRRVRPVGRRRPVHEPDVRAAARRVRRAGARARGLGRRDGTVPRVRLPPLAQPRAAEVPGEGLGRRTRPRGAGDGVPGRRAARRRRAAAPRPLARSRPRRRVRAARRPRRSWASRRARDGSLATSSGIVADLADAFGDGQLADDRAAEARDPRRGSATRRRAGRRARRRWTCARAPTRSARASMACTGIEFCKLAIGETKGRAMWLDRGARGAAAGLRRGRSGST